MRRKAERKERKADRVIRSLLFLVLPVAALLCLPAAPARAQTATPHGIALAWQESTSGVTSYNVWRSTTSGGPYTEVITGVTTTSYLDPAAGLTAGTTYYYVVQAAIGTDLSAASAQASATVPSGGFSVDPNAPTGVTATVQ